MNMDRKIFPITGFDNDEKLAHYLEAFQIRDEETAEWWGDVTFQPAKAPVKFMEDFVDTAKEVPQWAVALGQALSPVDFKPMTNRWLYFSTLAHVIVQFYERRQNLSDEIYIEVDVLNHVDNRITQFPYNIATDGEINHKELNRLHMLVLDLWCLERTKVLHNPDTFDEYTIFFPTLDHTVFNVLGASKNPFHFQGFGQFLGDKGNYPEHDNFDDFAEFLGANSDFKEIELTDLPKEVRQYIMESAGICKLQQDYYI